MGMPQSRVSPSPEAGQSPRASGTAENGASPPAPAEAPPAAEAAPLVPLVAGDPKTPKKEKEPASRMNRSNTTMLSTFASSRTRKIESYIRSYDRLQVAGVSPKELNVRLDTTGQNTLVWDEALEAADGSATLPQGSANLYLFPAITTDDGATVEAEGGMLQILQALLLAVCTETDIFDCQADVVGAMPLHSLMVANTPAAIETCRRVYTANPRLLLQLHRKHRAGFPLFTGESTLHICAVNQQEELLVYLVQLALSSLGREDVRGLLRSQAAGVFFHDMPMRFYGGTILSYTCCFDLRKAMVELISTGLVSLNSREDACVISGFLPIHAVTANSLESTYDFITQELPPEYRADPVQRSTVGRMPWLNVHNLLPLQLAARCIHPSPTD